MSKQRKPKRRSGGRWVYVDDRSPEEKERDEMHQVATMLSVGSIFNRSAEARFAAADQIQDYFPGDNEIPEGGAWILVKKSPQTEYTVPPMSIWFAEAWPMEGESYAQPRRVKIVTPRGELGLFPREYSIVREPQKYFEFIGGGMTMRFFGGDLSGVPEQQLFYLRSRGIAKADALGMLIGNIRAHGILWIETDRELASAFVRDHEWPDDSRIATIAVAGQTKASAP